MLDLHYNTIVSYVLGRSNNNKFILETVKKTLWTTPNSKPIQYSDRGFQYTSPQFKSLFGAQITQNMSRAGMCIDNGQWNRSVGRLNVKGINFAYLHFIWWELKYDEKNYIHFLITTITNKINGLSPIEYRAKTVYVFQFLFKRMNIQYVSCSMTVSWFVIPPAQFRFNQINGFLLVSIFQFIEKISNTIEIMISTDGLSLSCSNSLNVACDIPARLENSIWSNSLSFLILLIRQPNVSIQIIPY